MRYIPDVKKNPPARKTFATFNLDAASDSDELPKIVNVCIHECKSWVAGFDILTPSFLKVYVFY